MVVPDRSRTCNSLFSDLYWVAGKQIPFKKVGSAVRFKISEINEALEKGTLGKAMAKKAARKSVTEIQLKR